jgi:hypothetical protein
MAGPFLLYWLLFTFLIIYVYIISGGDMVFSILIGNNRFYGQFTEEKDGVEELERKEWTLDTTTGFWRSEVNGHGASIIGFPEIHTLTALPSGKKP